jgi:arginyl-tRNA synthetase
LAKQKSSDSPVFYVQYAHARIVSIIKKSKSVLREFNLRKDTGVEPLMILGHPSEIELAKEILRLPEIVADTAVDYQVQRLCLYSTQLAAAFHKFYHDCQVIGDDKKTSQARLELILAAKTALANTLGLLGISAPEKM